MLKVLLFIGAVGFISWQFAIFFNDIWLRDAQHKKLRHKFEDWWLTVEDLDKLKLALACTVKLNAFLDDIFGIRLFSGLAFGRISIAASGLLIASLSLLGLFSHEKLGIEPWKNYRETAKGVEDFIPQLQSSYRAMPITTLTTNVQLNHESHLFTTNVVTITNTSKTVLIEKLETVKLATQKYNTNTFVAIYSIVFLIVLFFLNALLCFLSLVISRLILREMIAAARPFSTLALLVTNFFLIVLVSSVFLLFLTVLDTPIIWYFLPVIFIFTAHSFSLFLVVLFGGQIAAWIFASPALKLVALIGMLPFIFTLAVSVFSYAAIIWRNAFHKCVSAILLRCAEKGPLTVIVLTFALIASFIAGLGRFIHWIR